MLRLTVFEIFAVKWLSEGPKTDPPLPFLVSHLMTAKDIVAKGGEALSVVQTSRRRWHLRRDVCPRTHRQIKITADDIYTTNAY